MHYGAVLRISLHIHFALAQVALLLYFLSWHLIFRFTRGPKSTCANVIWIHLQTMLDQKTPSVCKSSFKYGFINYCGTSQRRAVVGNGTLLLPRSRYKDSLPFNRFTNFVSLNMRRQSKYKQTKTWYHLNFWRRSGPSNPNLSLIFFHKHFF